ncbi:RNA polymerase sigma factor [Myxococcota bacterium]|nr:RNA polymerase sigma factor [Myxococcota bacterium]
MAAREASFEDVGAIEAPATLTLASIFEHHARDVWRIVGRLLGPAAPRADVDDLGQQVFLAVHRALPSYRGDSALTTWLYGIATRVVLQHLRGRRRYRAMIERYESGVITEPAPGVEETVAQREALVRVWRALEEMDPDRRIVLVLSELEGLGAREIGEALDLGEEAVRSRLRRARSELAERLRDGGRT